jgi:hypothetical protein
MMSSKSTHPAIYRASQFFAALQASLSVWAGGGRSGLSPADQSLVSSILPEASQQRLFAQMLPNDQRHAVAVARTLRQAGHNQPALLQAALLHDVGKCLGQPIIYRVLIVLAEAFWPEALVRLSTASAEGTGVSWWRRPFVIHAHHPSIGAAWAQEAGCDPLTIDLIAQHQDLLGEAITAEQRLLAVLQWADGMN